MKAILVKSYGEADQMYIGEAPTPSPKAQEILVKVHATALNRADTLQRRGAYPPPSGASEIMGLEIAGEVAEIGEGVTRWKKGDKVFGLISGGGYAEYAVIPEEMTMALPSYLSYEQAAAIPEVFLTAFQALNWLGKLQAGEKILIHAAASGVGTAAIQLAKAMKAEIFATASASKHSICYELGASKVIDYKSQDFQEEIKKYTEGQGVELILDFVAANYFHQNIQSLSMDGRLVILALLGGMEVEKFNLGLVLRKRLQIIGSTLRVRSLNYQIKLTKEFWSFAQPLFKTQELKPIIDTVYPWTEIVKAHTQMEANKNIGKLVITL
jgi:putative PIG3 family NAD(P)H quinone oxidoreductase